MYLTAMSNTNDCLQQSAAIAVITLLYDYSCCWSRYSPKSNLGKLNQLMHKLMQPTTPPGEPTTGPVESKGICNFANIILL